MKAFAVNSKKIKQPICIQVVFILEIKFQMYLFSKILPSAYVWYDLTTEKESICDKYSVYKRINWHTSDGHVEN